MFEHITRQDLNSFKRKHNILDGVDISLQKISLTNTITVDGKVYSLENLEPVEIFTQDATYTQNDISARIPEICVFQTVDNSGDLITVVKNPHDNAIRTIDIIKDASGSNIHLSSISPGIFATIQSGDYDLEELASRFILQHEEIPNNNKPSYTIPSTLFRFRIPQEEKKECPILRELHIAIAYDSTYCEQVGAGNSSLADAHTQAIVVRVSALYQQNCLCVKVLMSHLEGYCDGTTDPYAAYVDMNRSGCGNSGVLTAFSEYWVLNRRGVARHTAHLLSGKELECDEDGDCVVGCAYVSTTCDEYYGYGINHATFSEDDHLISVLLAHEMGHNNGAGHYCRQDYIMNPFSSSASKGFSKDSIQAMRRYFDSTDCVTVAPGVSTSSPTVAPRFYLLSSLITIFLDKFDKAIPDLY